MGLHPCLCCLPLSAARKYAAAAATASSAGPSSCGPIPGKKKTRRRGRQDRGLKIQRLPPCNSFPLATRFLWATTNKGKKKRARQRRGRPFVNWSEGEKRNGEEEEEVERDLIWPRPEILLSGRDSPNSEFASCVFPLCTHLRKLHNVDLRKFSKVALFVPS